MEESNQIHEIEQLGESFFDALDYFHFPYLENSVSDESNQSSSVSTPDETSPSISSPVTNDYGFSNSEFSSISSDTVQNDSFRSRYDGQKLKIYRDLKENEKNLDYSELTREILDDIDSFRAANSEIQDEKKTVSRTDDGEEFGDSNLFVFIAGLVVKAIGFHVNIFVSLLMFPVWGFYNSYMLVVDPFGAIRRSRGFLLSKFGSLLNASGIAVSPLAFGFLKDEQSIGKLLLRFGYAMFWSSYVCVVLCGLLVFSTLASGVVMRILVESPIEIREELVFDFTQKSPVAFVPLMSCGGVGCGLNCEETNLGRRVVPPYQKLQVNLQLTLPESTYNQKLGIFQVRVDLLSADGKVIASKRQPCMLKYKSELVQNVVTFFKIAPLLAGYTSETQTLKVNIRDLTAGAMPPTCVRVVLEQRAEFQPGAGIPEIYDASLKLESELPFVKRIIWGWRKTMFVWISMMLFMVKLMFALLCCRSLLVPRTRQRDFNYVDRSNVQEFLN